MAITAKEYLSQYRQLDIEINSKLEQIKELKERAVSISWRSGEASGSVSDKMGRTIARIVDAENEINVMIDRLLRLKGEIESTIAAVDDSKCRQVLTLRYINGHTLEKIAEKMNYSYMQICRIHKNALLSVTDILKKFKKF